ncbi:MAG: S8 family serine peptidase [Acidothermus cellulolyticus]|nr:S8 family serine peptidase [Acidothermus cellulolyticus]
MSVAATIARGVTWGDSRWRRFAAAFASAASIVGFLPVIGVTGTAETRPFVSAGESSYIVRATPGHLDEARAAIGSVGGRVGVDLSIINGVQAVLTASEARSLASHPGILSVTPDFGAKLQGSSYDPNTDAGGPVGLSSIVGYNAYWNAGFSGQGIGVALIDSGVVPVPALSAPGKIIYGPDFTPTGYFTEVRGLDTFGHGTFMAGLIAGRDPGATAPYWANSGYYLGVAPDANIISVKVADASGATMASAVIAAIQWVVAHRNDPGLNIKVLNLSLGVRDGLPYQQDPLDAAVEAAWKAGITVVAAAGNDGQVGMTAPANDPYVIAVGAIDTNSTLSVSDDTVASFSNIGDGTRNPDFVAPGTHIVGLRDPGSAIDQEYGNGPGSINASLMRGSGTSEAAAITSGAVALLLSQRPNLTPDQVKATLVIHSSWNLPQQQAGAGALNMAWVLNAATEYRTQNWPSATVSNAASPTTSAGWSLTPSRSTWTGSTWTSVDFTRSTWTGSTWTGSTWTRSTWTGCTWTGSTWTGSTWTGSTWTRSTWTNYSWS